MRERLVIESATESADAEGQPIQSFTTFDTIWARVEFLTGRELEAMQRINALITMTASVRYRTDITETMRINWRSNYWNINGILPDEFKQFMILALSKVS